MVPPGDATVDARSLDFRVRMVETQYGLQKVPKPERAYVGCVYGNSNFIIFNRILRFTYTRMHNVPAMAGFVVMLCYQVMETVFEAFFLTKKKEAMTTDDYIALNTLQK